MISSKNSRGINCVIHKSPMVFNRFSAVETSSQGDSIKHHQPKLSINHIFVFAIALRGMQAKIQQNSETTLCRCARPQLKFTDVSSDLVYSPSESLHSLSSSYHLQIQPSAHAASPTPKHILHVLEVLIRERGCHPSYLAIKIPVLLPGS